MAISHAPRPNTQPELRLVGGPAGLLLCFSASPSRRHFVAVHDGWIYEVLPVGSRQSLQGMWRARIRVRDGGVEIGHRDFPFDGGLLAARQWLQTRAVERAAGGGQ